MTGERQYFVISSELREKIRKYDETEDVDSICGCEVGIYVPL
jgi:hypothetical protein